MRSSLAYQLDQDEGQLLLTHTSPRYRSEEFATV